MQSGVDRRKETGDTVLHSNAERNSLLSFCCSSLGMEAHVGGADTVAAHLFEYYKFYIRDTFYSVVLRKLFIKHHNPD